jgi:hypothetical protein
VVAVTAYLVRGRAARLAVIGMALTTVTNVFMAAAFGSAAFVQPGIGRAYLNGVAGMPALNADTAYGPALTATALTSTVFFVISAIVLGTAIARSHRRLRWYGIAYATSLVVFASPGILYGVLQPVAGFALAAVTAALAVRLPRLSISPAADPARVRGTATAITA